MLRTKSKQIEDKHIFSLGDLVVIKSYPDTDPLSGDPLHVPPIMVVIGVEIENEKKKTHDTITGRKIAERIKYNLIWFDNKKSTFVNKIMYESFIKPFEREAGKKTEFEYQFGEVAKFTTSYIELKKKKISESEITTKKVQDKKEDEKKISTITPLVTFVCPELVVTGIRRSETIKEHDDFGNIRKIQPELFIKVMWFNPSLQKYSEFELPKECLINI